MSTGRKVAPTHPLYLGSVPVSTAATDGTVKVNTDDPAGDPVVYRREEVDALIAAAITSTPPPVNTVVVSPGGAGIVVALTQQFVATLRSLNGTVLTGRTVVWTSSNTGVATVNSSTGLVTGVGAGTATITATSEGKTGTATIQVINASVPLWYKVARDTWASLAGSYSGDAGTYWAADGSVSSVSANVIRENHYIFGRKTSLLEPAFDNGVLHSEDVSHSDWAKTGCTISGTAVGPDNGASSNQGVLPTAGATTLTDGNLHVQQSVTSQVGIRHFIGWHVTPNDRTKFLLQYKNRSGTYINAWFDLSTPLGSVGTTSGCTAAVIPLASGSYLCFLITSAQDSGAGTALMAGGFVDADSSKVCSSNGSTQAGYLWGAMSNKYGFLSSYVKTTTAVVSRAADQAKLPHTMTPGVRTLYVRYIDITTYQYSLDNAPNFIASIDGSTSQGTKYNAYYYSSTAPRVTFFSDAYSAGNQSITTVDPWVSSVFDEVEMRGMSDIAGGNMEIGLAKTTFAPSTGTWGSFGTEISRSGAETGSYAGAYGAGSVYVFLGQQSGGSHYSPLAIEEVKLIDSAVHDMATIRGQSVGVTPVASVTIVGPSTVVKYDDVYYTAIVKDAGGNELFGRVVSFQAGNANISVTTTNDHATDASNRAAATATGVTAGSSSIYATCEGITAFKNVTVPNFV